MVQAVVFCVRYIERGGGGVGGGGGGSDLPEKS